MVQLRRRKLRLPRGALGHLRGADPALGRVIDEVGRFDLRVGLPGDELAALTRSIIYQQLSGRAAATIVDRFVGLFGRGRFPTAAELLAVKDAKLGSAGLSRQKIAALRDLAKHVQSGRLPLREMAALDDAELEKRLCAVRGIGPWTAHMFLIFHMGRPNVWPTDDYAIRKAVKRLHRRRELPDKRAMDRVGRRYCPYCSVASWYLWRSLDGDAAI
jgi:3-methyladenine DNA glycosylase/8-oxoguanine DNA glycosylase